MKIFKTYVVETSYSSYEIEKSLIENEGGRLILAKCHSEDDLIEQCQDANALLIRQTPVTEKTFKSLKNLRIISRYGIGYDNIDVKAATKHNVLVTIVPDYCVQEVADHTIALLFSAIRRIPMRDRVVRKGFWDISSAFPVHRTDRSIMGFVGYGKTAREVRKRLSGFPFRFVAYDPYQKAEIFRQDNTMRLDFMKLVMVSHFISIHAPLTDETRHLFNDKIFRMMRKEAILVNTSRGGIVDQEALVEALVKGYICGAALDVYEDEPLPPSHPLCSLNNVILSDHAAWYSEESLTQLQREAALEVVRVMRGLVPKNPVNPEVTIQSNLLSGLSLPA